MSRHEWVTPVPARKVKEMAEEIAEARRMEAYGRKEELARIKTEQDQSVRLYSRKDIQDIQENRINSLGATIERLEWEEEQYLRWARFIEMMPEDHDLNLSYGDFEFFGL